MCYQGPPLAWWGQATLWGAYLGEGGGQKSSLVKNLSLMVGLEHLHKVRFIRTQFLSIELVVVLLFVPRSSRTCPTCQPCNQTHLLHRCPTKGGILPNAFSGVFSMTEEPLPNKLTRLATIKHIRRTFKMKITAGSRIYSLFVLVCGYDSCEFNSATVNAGHYICCKPSPHYWSGHTHIRH